MVIDEPNALAGQVRAPIQVVQLRLTEALRYQQMEEQVLTSTPSMEMPINQVPHLMDWLPETMLLKF